MTNEMADDKSRASIKEQINRNLKKAYEQALNEDVPDRFKDLLAQLRAKEGDK
ncbi:NepR family anti-sigma factor [Thioclava sp. GXIMD4216]|uniref:NepR family anti-sigma factor n=1 Tax=Thioclava litoralis TaxID=3076557 RepID=A0ABZ1DV41_9RHOB|nr:NepR family anti-sigma factor [Thioclava sp. FTW29]